ncbi:PqqD family peptide modification chaperone [Azospirillum sp.]|uniref:PqqD family peptide modification chaperone n=1 Tax=Azospirillum sp. TaxID=34012 RepID=UPI002635D0CA|nr:PqqD family peptide modification chaperone [Azospirillum sp.]
MLSLSDHVTINIDILTTEIDSEIVMMDVDSGNYYNLDEIGSVIWRRLAAPLAVERLCRDLETLYDAPATVIEQDVLALLTRMEEKRLIRRVA